MLIRYFGAAKAAAGTEEETLDEGPLTLGELAEKLGAKYPAAGPGVPVLATVIARSTFLVNETAAQDRAMLLQEGDVVDILPPFAGG
ncbi:MULTISPECIES: MoaD/ThiS family protein [unclassified Arthrobacter]|uniref:MoaD/ThiS family protein n=1 Tax=unclassified Arthrobacter TaxID=235627 RepID=UPI001D132A97|nr:MULTISPECIES: MoaD/ThiS family protein [unclassified Arthrobacter]MCC3280582.1 MoaD/ThiS family protein [Arthrobacter sp. zg-Y40]MCC9178837.1 MoaD/ThiS family protein [Arthrobacter sp. zg-Y750]MCC3277092.1 MoaD/ThiS family protein [Arthrobacter sp. zg-Y20]MDK1317253.1 MoaD/ThiS family protein [Arthrobacter sp. zg.Y20]MDK1328882.1 MoaD/ThiS family protein [Arthrobacter sp. zg-Y1143]